jgi:tRNA pseudouridine55 synthase
LNGVLVIDKPGGWTSHDVVARLRKGLKVRKAGHGGTLDPLATGVLPVYLNEATKLVPFNLEGTKEYAAVIRFGQETDTLDADGKIVSETREFFFPRERLEETLNLYRGTIRQTPPAFSAIKKGGVPVYRQARAGQRPVLSEREAVIESLELQELSLPRATIAVTCGRGTYIRSLAADIGRSLGCGAHVAELRRLRSGLFRLEQAISLEEFANRAERGTIEEKILPLKESVALAALLQIGPAAAEKIRRGKPLRLEDLAASAGGLLAQGKRVGLCEGSGDLLAIVEAKTPETAGAAAGVRILRVFHPG